MDRKGNLSTEHQPSGGARFPGAELDRDRQPSEEGAERPITTGNGQVRDAGPAEQHENLGGNTDQDGASAADQAENLGANTVEEDQNHAAVQDRSSATHTE